MKFRERIYRFMQGRYGAGGADAFTRFLSILTFVFILFQGAVYLYHCNCTDCLYVFPASVQKLL